MSEHFPYIAFDAGHEIYYKLNSMKTEFGNVNKILSKLNAIIKSCKINGNCYDEKIPICQELLTKTFDLSIKNERDRKLTSREDIPAGLELIAEQIALHTEMGMHLCYKIGHLGLNYEQQNGSSSWRSVA